MEKSNMIENLICHNLEPFRDFKFMTPGNLSDGEIELILAQTVQTDIKNAFCPEYKFDIFLLKSNIKIGELGFRLCLTEALSRFGGNIGYGIYEEYRGNHYAGKAFVIAKEFIKLHGIKTILITCGEKNIASRKTCEYVGAELVKIEPTKTDTGEIRPTCYYLLEIN